MNKAFEKILERLEATKDIAQDDSVAELVSTRIWNKALHKAMQIVQEVAEEYNGGWISIKDRLPDKAGSYLVIGKSGGATVTRWYMPSEFYPEGHFGGNSADYIRYWMPRPEPPKERD